MKRISKKVREDAALICAIAASAPPGRDCYDYEIAIALGLWRGSLARTSKQPAMQLALAAWSNAYHYHGCSWTQATDAEAEALLRTGWVP